MTIESTEHTVNGSMNLTLGVVVSDQRFLTDYSPDRLMTVKGRQAEQPLSMPLDP